MAFNYFIRRVSSASLRPLYGPIFPVPYVENISRGRRFTTAAGLELFRALESHQYNKSPDPDVEEEGIPDGCPFEIRTTPTSIQLERKCEDEKIRVEVDVSNSTTTGDDPSIPIIACISKGRQFLKFRATLQPNHLAVHSFTMSEDHVRLEGFEKYLEDRGIKPSILKSVLDYYEEYDYEGEVI